MKVIKIISVFSILALVIYFAPKNCPITGFIVGSVAGNSIVLIAFDYL